MSLVGLSESIVSYLAQFLEQSNIDLHKKKKAEDDAVAAFVEGQLQMDRGWEEAGLSITSCSWTTSGTTRKP